MKQRHLPMLGALLFGTWAGPALAATAHAPGAAVTAWRGFNFAYLTEGSRTAAPTQVFDDGRRTYLQFNALDQIPELWSDDGRARSAPRRLLAHLESPYLVIDQVLPRLRLVLDGQDTVLRNQAWQRARPQGNPAPAIWTDRLPFGPEDVPAARTLTHGARLAEAGDAPPPHPVEPGAEPASPTLVDPAALDWPQAPPGEQMLDARVEALRRQAADLLHRAELAHQGELAAALRSSIESLEQAQQRHLLQGRPAPATPAPPRQPLQRQLLALADTRVRSDLGASDPPPDGPPGGGVPPAPPPRAAGRRPAAAARTPAEAARAAAAGLAAIDPQAGEVPGHADGSAGAPGAPGAAYRPPAADAAAPELPLVLEVRDNQRLSQALAQFLETQGWRLEWESASDFVVRRGYKVRGANLRQVLLETLGEYRLSAVLYGGNLVVAVSGGEP